MLHHGAIFRTELTRNVQWSWSFKTPSARICVCGVAGPALSIDTHHPTHHAGDITPKMWSVMECLTSSLTLSDTFRRIFQAGERQT